MELKDFQKQAVDKLSNTFIDLWKTGNRRLPLIFKAPTGAGKTIMMAEFLRCLDTNYQFEEDKAYLWISFGGDDSYSQSYKKLWKYFNDGVDIGLKNIGNLNEGKLYKNNVFFINWSKIKASNKEGRKLRKETETTDEGLFDDFINKTKKERDIVLIIDEAHREAGERLPLYNEIIDLVDPKIIIKVTATPENIPNAEEIQEKRAGYVGANEEDVIESGLIKEKIITQTEEEIKALDITGLNEDEKMLELAYNKRLELKKHYEDLGLDINPLVLIQLPSDFKETEQISGNKKEAVLFYLKKKGIKDDEIAIWLSNEKKNLEGVEQFNSEINFMLFKQAPATGWDCPRADILVMFREIKNPTFHTQILGRIKRMPEGKHYDNSVLNKAYLYTNYSKNHIRDVEEIEKGNKQYIFHTNIKKDITPFVMQSTFISRTDFNTLERPIEWQASCIKSFNEHFGTKSDNSTEENQKIISRKIDLRNSKVDNTIIVDAEIDGFDSLEKQLKAKGKDIDYGQSEFDRQKLYNLLTFNTLKKQEDEKAKYNPSRSWDALKRALNVYFGEHLGLDNYYGILINEFLKEPSQSELQKAIYKALVDFRPIHDKIVENKEENKDLNIIVPTLYNSYTDDFELLEKDMEGESLDIKKNVYENFYIRKEYNGKNNEVNFIKFLEVNPSVKYWHKQDDSGKDAFAVKYYDETKKAFALFYPDFIIKTTDDKTYIIDTKAGFTATSKETADKARGLQEWLSSANGKNFLGGIAKHIHPNWMINTDKKYKDEEWKELNF